MHRHLRSTGLNELASDTLSETLPVGVSFDTDQVALEKAVKDLGISWPQLSELKGWDNLALRLYDLRGIPAAILYSPDGKVVATQLNGEGLRNKLAEIYDK